MGIAYRQAIERDAVRFGAMSSTAYVPARAEVVSINLSPTGSAKSGHRAAVVLSTAERNDRDGRAI